MAVNRQKSKGSIWFELFELLHEFMNVEQYPINDTGIEVLRIVDTVLDEGGDYINENIIGNSFVKADNSIYDETGTLVQSLVKGDSFVMNTVTYFLPSNLEVVELGLQWNNTLIGDYGISLEIGGFSIDEKDDLSKLWRTPQIIIEMGEESEIDVMERDGNTSTEFKKLTFDFIILVSEVEDIFKNKTGYGETNRVEKILSTIIYDFTQWTQCGRKLPVMKWTHKMAQIYVQRPMVISAYGNTIKYR